MSSPIASNDFYSINAGSNLFAFGTSWSNGASLLGNDSDADGDQLQVVSVNEQSITKNTWSAFSGSDGGTFRILSNGAMIFTSGDDFDDLYLGQSRTTTLTYTVADADGNTSSAIVTVTINGTVPPPAGIEAVDDLLFVPSIEDGVLSTINVLANDKQVTGQSIIIEANDQTISSSGFISGDVNGEALGLFTVESNGLVTFDPNDDFGYLAEGEEETVVLNYTVKDENGIESSATYSVVVTGIDDAPVAQDDTLSTFSASGLESLTSLVDYGTVDPETGFGRYGIVGTGILSNDADADGDSILIESINDPTQAGALIAMVDGGVSFIGDNGGVFTVNSVGNVSFDPGEDFRYLAVGDSAQTSFSYNLAGGSGPSATGNVVVTVAGSNDGIFASSDVGFSTGSNTVLDTSAVSLLDNDNTTYSLNGSAANKSIVSLAEVEAIQFQNGIWSEFIDSSSIVGAGQTVRGHVLDGANSYYAGVFTINADGTFDFDPNGEFLKVPDGESVEVTAAYIAQAENGNTDRTVVSVTVVGENDSPIANDDLYSIRLTNFDLNAEYVDTGYGIYDRTLFGNDQDDPGAGALRVVDNNGDSVPGGEQVKIGNNGGEFTIFENGEVTFSGTAAYEALLPGLAEGEELITSTTYRVIDDGGLTSNVATVSVRIIGENDGPVANDDDSSVLGEIDEETILTLTYQDLLANDTDIDTGAILNVKNINARFLKGDLFDNGDGTLTYDPFSAFKYLNDGEQYIDSFNYIVTDEHGEESTATVSITVNGIDEIEVLANDDDSLTVSEDATDFSTIDVLTNDIDGNSRDTLSINSFDLEGLRGTLVLNEDESFSYSPDGQFEYLAEGESAETSFTYEVRSSDGSTDVASVTITVEGERDDPDAVDDNFNFADNSGYVYASRLLVNDEIEGATGISSLDLRGASFNSFRLDSKEKSELSKEATEQLGNGNTYSTSFSYTIEDESGLSDTADVVVNYNGAGSYVREAQPVTNIQLNDGDVRTLNIDDFLANTLTVDTTELNSPNGWDASDLTNKGFDVQDLGGGSFTIEGPNLAFGESEDGRIILHTIDLDGEEQKVIINVESQGTSDDLMVGTEAQLATDDVFNIMESDLGTTLGNLLANDAPDLQLVSIERVGETSIYQDPIVGTQVKTLTSNYGDFSLEKGGFSSKLLGPNDVIAQQFEYTVVDDFGNFDTATITVNVQGEQDGIFMDSNDNPLVAIYENTTLVFDDSILVGNAYDNDGVQDKDFGAGLSAVNFDTTTLQGVFTNNGDGSYTYDPSIAFSSLDNGETALEQIAYDIVSGDGSSTAAILELEILGVDDPLVP